jgi:hypothetical protein
VRGTVAVEGEEAYLPAGQGVDLEVETGAEIAIVGSETAGIKRGRGKDREKGRERERKGERKGEGEREK